MNLLRKASRYAQVGLLCALLNNAIVIGMDQAGFHYALGVMAGFIIVMLIAYLLHASYTFEVRPSPRGWLTFVGANLSGVPLSMGFMVIMCDGFGLSASLAMPVATILLFAWNFLLAHRLLVAPARRDA
jgi:putative flippase GtrA